MQFRKRHYLHIKERSVLNNPMCFWHDKGCLLTVSIIFFWLRLFITLYFSHVFMSGQTFAWDEVQQLSSCHRMKYVSCFVLPQMCFFTKTTTSGVTQINCRDDMKRFRKALSLLFRSDYVFSEMRCCSLTTLFTLMSQLL